MIVTLSWAEMQLAYMVAGQRRIMNMKKKLPGKYGAPEREGSEELDLVAARGEMAVAKALNLYWTGTVGDYGAVDVGGLVEVEIRHVKAERPILHDNTEDHCLDLLGMDPHSSDRWYIGTSNEHYQCFNVYKKETKPESVSDTVYFRHKNILQCHL